MSLDNSLKQPLSYSKFNFSLTIEDEAYCSALLTGMLLPILELAGSITFIRLLNQSCIIESANIAEQ